MDNKLKMSSYKFYSHTLYTPPGYHRYHSNNCNPKQDNLPITFPDPNEGIPIETNQDQLELMYGSLPCYKCNRLNYCQ